MVVTSGAVGRIAEMASRPLVLPDAYSGEGKWSQWIYLYESVADVNEWDDVKDSRYASLDRHKWLTNICQTP